MATLIGTDEAGYGPNFGPLVISATRWRVPGDPAMVDLYQSLKPVVERSPAADRSDLVAIADSKAVYKPGGGLAGLERGVLSCGAALGWLPDHWHAAWEFLAPESVDALRSIPWYADYDCSVPVDGDRAEIAQLSRSLQQTFHQSDVHLQAMESVAVFPARFNQLVSQEGTKGAALTAQTLALVRRMVDRSGDGPILVQCDKHGGRNRYAPMLQSVFPEHLVEIRHESRAQSIYRWGPESRRIEFRFVAKGESFLPAALASMASKYLRELAMRAFNAFWLGYLPDLKPTAGYPVDAARFRGQIQGLQSELGIADQVLWRNR